MKKYTAYEITNQGRSISPDMTRDGYYRQEFLKLKEVLELIDELTIYHKVKPKTKNTIIVGEGTLCSGWNQRIIQPDDLKQRITEGERSGS